jgi:hypothetical protein
MAGISGVALIVLLSVFLGFVPALLTASVASKRGRDGLTWFFVALIWDFLFGGVFVLVAPILGFGALAAIVARDQPLTAAALGGGALALAAVSIVIAFLPLFLVSLSGGRGPSSDAIQRARLARMRMRRIKR